MTLLVLSFLAGVLTILAPCVLPLLPVILWASVENHTDRYRPYIIIASLSISIIIFSLALKATTLFIWLNSNILTSFSGWIIIAFWLITLFPNLWKKISLRFANNSNQQLGKSAQKKWILGSVLIGFSLWPVFSSCSPTYWLILAVILPISFGLWIINLIAYTLGLAIMLLLISRLWQKFSWKLQWISNPNSLFKKVLWVIFLIVWLLIVTGFDKKIEASLIKNWFLWGSNIENIFQDKLDNEIKSLESNSNTMEHTETNSIKKKEEAYFAGGCFWCIESIMDWQDGVYQAISWYAWWTEENANYHDVSNGKTNHREAVKVEFNPDIISYENLVSLFFQQIDPTDEWGQFADRGFQYTTAVYYTNNQQKEAIENFMNDLEKSEKFKKDIVTKVEDYTTFFRAEEYHQNYAQKKSFRYKVYKKWSGREDYINETWSEESLRTKLTPLQYRVTQENGTEKAFDNKYWDNKELWIYVDIINGTPLFSSADKFESGSGWPSFTQSIDQNNIIEKEDKKLFTTRTEIRSKISDSHLWHVFEDGPKDKWWLRYCINSAALKFIPYDELEGKWYNEYKKLFEQ